MAYDPTKDPDDEKLKELILFIAERSSADDRFGATKLNKLLFFSDFIAYERLGSSITGHPYQRLPQGPAPKRYLPIANEMVNDKSLAFQERHFHGHTQKRPIPLRQPNLQLFTAEEIAIVTEVLESLWRKNAKGISTLSHEFSGWKLAKKGESIPYQVALVQFKKPRKRDVEKALAMGDELALLRKDADADS